MTESEKYNRIYQKYGDPFTDIRTFENKWMVSYPLSMWIDTHIPSMPSKIYINRDIASIFEETLNRIITVGVYKEIKTFDGCFNPRMVRGSKTKPSIHSWGLAVDLNAGHNPLNMTRQQCKDKGLTPFTELFIEVWRDAGWTCGADFKRPDLMHFEYTAHL